MAMMVRQVFISACLTFPIQGFSIDAHNFCKLQFFLTEVSYYSCPWGTTYVGKFQQYAFITSKEPTWEKYIIFRSLKIFVQVLSEKFQVPKADLSNHPIAI